MNELEKTLGKDPDGMAVYEYIVNHSDSCDAEMPQLIDMLCRADASGQFLASSARYLHAIDGEKFRPWVGRLIECAIDKDRERRPTTISAESTSGYIPREPSPLPRPQPDKHLTPDNNEDFNHCPADDDRRLRRFRSDGRPCKD